MSMITQRTPTTTTTLGAAAGAVSAEDAPAPDECRIVIAEVFEETAFYAMDDEIHDVNMAEADRRAYPFRRFVAACCVFSGSC